MKFVLLSGVAAVVMACSGDPIAPTPSALSGTWVTPVQSFEPNGTFTREWMFLASGNYVFTVRSRGAYPSVPADSVISFTSEYGSYTLDGNTLRTAQDSVIGWDLLGGSFRQIGPRGISIEGPPTDPVIELTATKLVLRFSVNPGNGYTPVKQVYYRQH